MEQKCISIELRGRVQGVAFRHHTKIQAEKLGVEGLVRNQSDGSVYIEACGSEDQLELFINWCHRGPLMANVTGIKIIDIPSKTYKGFSIRY